MPGPEKGMQDLAALRSPCMRYIFRKIKIYCNYLREPRDLTSSVTPRNCRKRFTSITEMNLAWTPSFS